MHARALSSTDVGKEIADHSEHHKEHPQEGHSGHERWLSIAEAVLLSVVALLAAWSGYSAAKWDSEASLSIAEASAARAQANRDDIEAVQIRTLDSVAGRSHPAEPGWVSRRPGYVVSNFHGRVEPAKPASPVRRPHRVPFPA